MARRVLPFAAGAAVLLSLAGCGDYRQAQRPAWRTQAENACMAQRLIHVLVLCAALQSDQWPGHLRPDAALSCDGAARRRSHLQHHLYARLPDDRGAERLAERRRRPAAQARFNSRVVELIGMGTYSCRGINGMAGAQLSEHAFGNAMDVGGFRLADGRIISIVRDWYHGDEAAQAFLRDVHSGACSHFTTVLGPGYNIFHYNHFHVDLAMHGNMSTGPRPDLPADAAGNAGAGACAGRPARAAADGRRSRYRAGWRRQCASARAACTGGGNLDAAIPPPAPIASSIACRRQDRPIGRLNWSEAIGRHRRRSSPIIAPPRKDRPRAAPGFRRSRRARASRTRRSAPRIITRRRCRDRSISRRKMSAALRQVQIRAAARHDARGRSLCARRSPRRLGSLAISDGSSLFGSGP